MTLQDLQLRPSPQVANAAPAAQVVEMAERGRPEKISRQIIRRSVILLFKQS